MARSRFCRVCRDLHDLDGAWPEACVGHFGTVSAGAGDARFYVQSDNIDAFRSMADGRTYDSKSAYRADLKARGLVEVGNDSQGQIARRPNIGMDRGARREAIRQTYRQLGG